MYCTTPFIFPQHISYYIYTITHDIYADINAYNVIFHLLALSWHLYMLPVNVWSVCMPRNDTWHVWSVCMPRNDTWHVWSVCMPRNDTWHVGLYDDAIDIGYISTSSLHGLSVIVKHVQMVDAKSLATISKVHL